MNSTLTQSTQTCTVRFEYCISLGFITVYRESEKIVVPAESNRLLAGLPYNLITILLGWWGIPWGIILTPVILWNNLNGGREIEDDPTDALS